PGGAAVHHADPGLPRLAAGSLDGVARFVGELAEVDLVLVRGLAQHPDVGAGTEHAVLAGPQYHGLHAGVFETQPLNGVVQFDVDAQVVGIELQLIAGKQTAGFVHVHGERRYLAIHGQFPVAVAIRCGLEIDDHGPASRRVNFRYYTAIPAP